MDLFNIKEEEKKIADKNELLQELVAGLIKWNQKGRPEYALAYQRLLNVFTSEEDIPDNKK
jgi:hypothetical protein